MSRITKFRNQNSTNKSSRASKARSYESGYLSRSTLAVMLGLKPQGGWITVQKALCRIGYMKPDGLRKYVVSEEGARYSKVHEELESGDVLKSWVVWAPIVVEHLREAVAWVLANPGLHPVTGNPVGTDRNEPPAIDFPGGFKTVTGHARDSGVTPVFAAKMFVEWGLAELDAKGRVVARKPVDSTAPLCDRPRLFPTGEIDRDTGEPKAIHIYPERMTQDLKDEWREREAKVSRLVAQSIGSLS